MVAFSSNTEKIKKKETPPHHQSRTTKCSDCSCSTNYDPANMLGRTFQTFENSGFRELCVVQALSSLFTDKAMQMPRAPVPTDEHSYSNLTFLPMHPGIKYIAIIARLVCLCIRPQTCG